MQRGAAPSQDAKGLDPATILEDAARIHAAQEAAKQARPAVGDAAPSQEPPPSILLSLPPETAQGTSLHVPESLDIFLEQHGCKEPFDIVEGRSMLHLLASASEIGYTDNVWAAWEQTFAIDALRRPASCRSP